MAARHRDLNSCFEWECLTYQFKLCVLHFREATAAVVCVGASLYCSILSPSNDFYCLYKRKYYR